MNKGNTILWQIVAIHTRIWIAICDHLLLIIEKKH